MSEDLLAHRKHLNEVSVLFALYTFDVMHYLLKKLSMMVTTQFLVVTVSVWGIHVTIW